MSIAVASALASALGFYLVLGLAFAVFFVIFGAARVVPAAKRSGFAFRFTIFWGAILLWPVLLVRLINGPPQLVPPRTWRRAHARIWVILIPVVALGIMMSLMLMPLAPVNDVLPKGVALEASQS